MGIENIPNIPSCESLVDSNHEKKVASANVVEGVWIKEATRSEGSPCKGFTLSIDLVFF